MRGSLPTDIHSPPIDQAADGAVILHIAFRAL